MNIHSSLLKLMIAAVCLAPAACKSPSSGTSTTAAADDFDIREIDGRTAEAHLRTARDQMTTLQSTAAELSSPDVVAGTRTLVAINEKTIAAAQELRAVLKDLDALVRAMYQESNADALRMRISAQRVRDLVLAKIDRLVKDSDTPSSDDAVLLQIQALAHRVNTLAARSATTGTTALDATRVQALSDYQQALTRAVTLVGEIHAEVASWRYDPAMVEKNLTIQGFCMGNEAAGGDSLTGSLKAHCDRIIAATMAFAHPHLDDQGVEVAVTGVGVLGDAQDRLMGSSLPGRRQLYQDLKIDVRLKSKRRIKQIYQEQVVLPAAAFANSSLPATTVNAKRLGADGALSKAWSDGLAHVCSNAMAKFQAYYRDPQPGRRFVVAVGCSMPVAKSWLPANVPAHKINKGPGEGANQVTAEMTLNITSVEFE